jgi:hypothetical protein
MSASGGDAGVITRVAAVESVERQPAGLKRV